MSILTSTRLAVLLGMAGLLLSVTASSASAQALANYEDNRLRAANEAYESSRYGETVELTEEHLEDDASTVERAQAYRLQGLALVAQGDEQRARNATDNLIRLYPAYETSAQDPPAFQQLVEESKSRYANGDLNRTQAKEDPMQKIYTTTAIVLSVAIGAFGMWDMFLR